MLCFIKAQVNDSPCGQEVKAFNLNQGNKMYEDFILTQLLIYINQSYYRNRILKVYKFAYELQKCKRTIMQ